VVSSTNSVYFFSSKYVLIIIIEVYFGYTCVKLNFVCSLKVSVTTGHLLIDVLPFLQIMQAITIQLQLITILNFYLNNRNN